MPRHKNDYGFWENVDRLPVPGCGCLKCSNAADRDALRSPRRRGRRGGGGAVEGIVTAVTAFSGLTAEPPARQVHDAADGYDQARSSLVTNRDEYLDEQTRAVNDGKGGSGRSR